MVKKGNKKYMTHYMRTYRERHDDVVARALTRYYVRKYIDAFQNLNDLEPLENMIKDQQQKILVHANS